MRALAGFVMRGREQAVLVAALSTATLLLSWLGAAVVALVTLRKGTRAGLQVLLWALLPAVLITHFMREVGTLAVLLRSEEHTSELQSRGHLVCRLLLEKKKHMQ